MMNELIELFAGAYNNIISEDYINHDYFLSVLVIVITACVILGGFAVCVAALVAVGRALLRKGG